MADSDVTQAEFEKALEAVILSVCPPEIKADDITEAKVRKAAHCGKPRAKKVIAELLKAGVIVEVQRRDGAGRRVTAWRLKGTNGQDN